MKIRRETWRALALVGAGWFIHDAVWHLLMAVFGMTGMVTLEFSLPDLGALGIYPDRAVQAAALLIAVVLGLALLGAAGRLRTEE